MKKPIVYISRCFGIAKCRYDGDWVIDKNVETIKKYIDFRDFCPETGIGFPSPREKIRVVRKDGVLELLQPATGRFFTGEMVRFSTDFINSIGRFDGFILKGKSPSCGVKNTKLYDYATGELISTGASGFFASTLLRLSPETPVITEKSFEDVTETAIFLDKVFKRYGGTPNALLTELFSLER